MSKLVGLFYDEEIVKKLVKEKGWMVIEDVGRGWRRVVLSFDLKGYVEVLVIVDFVEKGFIVIVSGGGGVLVIEENGEFKGVEVVIDKDLVGEKLVEEVKVDIFMIFMDVNGVVINYGKFDEKWFGKVIVDELKCYYKEGYFKKGSMGLKVFVVIRFVEWGGERVVIVFFDRVVEVFEGKMGM